MDGFRVHFIWFLLHFLLRNGCHAGRLHVQGTHLVKDGQRVFLSGTNLAWVSYGHDFGNNQYQRSKTTFESYLSQIHNSGGNSIRVWLHIEGETSPHFTSDGHVDKTDAAGSLISDMRSFLVSAKRFNVLVFFVLWNGAKKQSLHYRLDGLIRDTNKLQSYIDHCLKPMVNALKGEPALGGWEIMNEPEGEIIPDHQSNDPCQDTTKLHNSGAGWEGHLYSAHQLQRFINWQTDAIRTADPGAMVTVGVWNPKSNTNSFGFRNLYTDHCLVAAGGRSHGKLTFFQMHTYASNGHFDGYSPFQHHATEFGLSKPLVIGEFREESGTNKITDMYNHAFYFGYSGAWAWQAVDNNWNSIKTGMAWLRGRNDQQKGGQVGITVYKKNEGNRWKYIVALLTFSLTVYNMFGRNSMEGLFLLNYPLCWNPTKIDIYGALRFGLQQVIGIVMVKALHVCMDDVRIAIIDCISYSASFVIEAFATDDFMMYLVSVVGTLGLLTVPMFRSMMSQMTSPQKQGALFASIAAVETATNCIGAVSSNSVYIATVKIQRGFTLLLFASFSATAMVLFIIFMVGNRSSKTKTLNDP